MSIFQDETVAGLANNGYDIETKTTVARNEMGNVVRLTGWQFGMFGEPVVGVPRQYVFVYENGDAEVLPMDPYGTPGTPVLYGYADIMSHLR